MAHHPRESTTMWHSTATPTIELASGITRIAKLARTLTAGIALFSAASIQAADRVAPKPDWSVDDMPSQHGRIALITGGTSGMGYEDALALALR